MTVSANQAGDARDRAEGALAAIWRDLLGVERVLPRDNFFQLGGDSVLGVRVAARAAKAGLNFTPQEMLRCRTLRELAETALLGDSDPGPEVLDLDGDAGVTMFGEAPAPADTAGSGAVPLSPIMHSLLDLMPGGARGFCTLHALEITGPAGVAAVRAAVEHVVARHETLRYRFHRNTLGWRIECQDEVSPAVFDSRTLPPGPESDHLAEFASDVDTLAQEVDLERGPALRVRHFDRGGAGPGWLALVIHHYVFDNMAIVVLLDDLDAALAETAAGHPLPVPVPSRAWRAYSQHLRDMATSDELAAELPYWTGVMRAGAPTVPPPGRPGTGGVLTRTLPPERTAAALTQGAQHDREAAALCAVACAVARWRGTGTAYLLTEGAATPSPYRLGGRPPAVGWFTSLHPLALDVDPAAHTGANLPAVRERLRAVPHDGVGYGILRHLSPPSDALAALRALPEPDVLAVHTSYDGSTFDSGMHLLRNRHDLFGPARTRFVECFPLAITTSATAEGLTVAVLHDGRYGPDAVESLADALVTAFTELAGPHS